MSKQAVTYCPDVRERAVGMVLEHRGEHSSPWAALASIAGKIGCTAETFSVAKASSCKARRD
ncbi:hypothetical protein XthCFBP4691_16360 [Xanthomonas theicola]|uniref:Transposase n=1 Tax=Xanthomonas theicola TaxID=56464 RepID=A0A2S6ZBP4_9XANT|nr:hypothetical protein XthCFBP4691_16360 [Xanthomonas theicola]